jgi:hypothetical protein
MFCAFRLIFGGTKGVRSHFNVLSSLTHFRRFRRRPIPFSCFLLRDMFLAVPRASGPFLMFCASRLIFNGTEDVGSHFHVCAPGLVFGGTEDVLSRFHIFRSRTYFWRYRGYQVPFSRFALPNSFSAVPRASGAFFMFCAPELVFGGIEGVVSHFHVLRFQTHFRRYRGHRVPFTYFFAP